MSVTYTTDIFCEITGDTCLYWVHGVSGRGPNVKAARKVAKRLGWKRIDGQDICPNCYDDVILAGPCPNDTDGDGNCGRRFCPYCQE